MRLGNSRKSNNVEDRRGQEPMQASSGNPAVMMLLMRFLPTLMRTKIGKFIIFGGAIFLAYQQLTGGSLPTSLNGSTNQAPQISQSSNIDTNSPDAVFASKVLATTEDVWGDIFGAQYQAPKMVLYTGLTNTGCGQGSAQSGPFYCPADQTVYIDLSFMQELKKLGAPGDFAFAYVIAHEVGHHLQTLMGTSGQVSSAQKQLSKADANALNVKLELQADCYAGVWGHYAQNQLNVLESGDIEEGLQAAGSIGDDTLMKNAGQAVHPEAFTHGTSAQRVQWFKAGFTSGDFKQCNTFS